MSMISGKSPIRLKCSRKAGSAPIIPVKIPDKAAIFVFGMYFTL